MENQEKHFVKTSSEAIKSLVSKGVPGYTKKKKTKKKPQNMQLSLKVWLSSHKFRL